MNNQALYREIVSFQEQADLQLIQKIGSTFRSELPANRFATKAIRSFVKGRNPLPGELTQTVKTAGRWVERMDKTSTIFAALSLGSAAKDCFHDILYDPSNLKNCAGNLGSFVGGAVVGELGVFFISSLALGGFPLIAGSIAIAGLSVAGGMGVKALAEQAYSWAN